jgi:hypothetical protein
MTSQQQTGSSNIFAPALALNSDQGPFLTREEFQQTVAVLTHEKGKLTGGLVRKIRRDWEALGKANSHPATQDAVEAYRSFVRRFGALELLELLAA